MMRTDLAAECLRQSDSLPEGVFYTEQALQQGKITMVEIATEEAQRKIGKPMGLYVTLEASPFWEEDSASPQWIEAVAVGLRQFLPEQGTILVAGLGNREITPDALGPAVAEQVLVTRHLTATFPELRTVAAIVPNVLGKTGLEAAETIRAVTEEVKPSAVIVVDAMASASLERLGTTVQLANTGIIPGAGVLNARKGLNEESLGVPVIAMGIPTVVDLGELLPEPSAEPMMTTPRQIDLLIQRGATFLASCINRALHPSLTLEELLLLQS